MLFYEAPYIKIFWDEEHRCVHTEWHGFVKSEDVQNGLTRALDLAKKKKAQCYLGDLHDMHVYTDENKEWIGKNFYPQFADIGIKRLAFVKPIMIAARLSLERLLTKFPVIGVEVSFFDDVEAASRWLFSKTKAK